MGLWNSMRDWFRDPYAEQNKAWERERRQEAERHHRQEERWDYRERHNHDPNDPNAGTPWGGGPPDERGGW